MSVALLPCCGVKELEERVLGAVRDRILIPENVAYAVERALEIVRARLVPSDFDGDQKRLADLETKIERAVDLADRDGRDRGRQTQTGSAGA